MISFYWPDALWLLLLLPLLVAAYFWLLRRKKKSALRYANMAVLKQAIGRGPGWRRHVPPAVLLLAVAVLITAVARPAAVVTLPTNRATIILAMDVSGSMRAQDIEPSRIEASQKAAKQFIADLPADVEIGIVSFSGDAKLVQVPTIDRSALNGAIDRFHLSYGTAVGDGILASLDTIFPDQKLYKPPGDRGGLPRSLSGNAYSGNFLGRSLDDPAPAADAAPQHVPVRPGSYDSAVIVLLTDGQTTQGSDPIEAGQTAADYGVRVYTLGFGTEQGSVLHFGGYSMHAVPDLATLRKIADTTNAQFFNATSADELTHIYKTLSSRLATERKLTEISFIFAAAGAALVLLSTGLSMLWLGRVA